MHKRMVLIILFVALLPQPMITAVSATSLQSKAGETLMCLCGCGQSIKNCPHEKCGFAIPAQEEIKKMSEAGQTDDSIIEFFLNKYGEEILAAPQKKGFNLLGYIIPFAALLVAAGVIVAILKSWARRGVKDEEETLPLVQKDINSDINNKIEKELEDLD